MGYITRRVCRKGSLGQRRHTCIEGRTNNAGGGGPAPTVPKVLSSTIYDNNHKRIIVEWDQEMQGSTDIRFAINIIVDGAVPIVPNAVLFSGKFMTLSDVFHPGQVVTWAYDDQNTTERLSTKVGDIEADNQTYAVMNNAVVGPDDWIDEHGKEWEDEHGNIWKTK